MCYSAIRGKLVVNRQRNFLFVCLLLLFSAIVYLPLFDSLPPGELFRFPLVVLIPSGLIVVSVICTWGLLVIKPIIRHRGIREEARKARTIIFIVLFAVFIALCAFVAIGFTDVARSSGSGELRSAKRNFKTVTSGHISRLQVDSTLLKLERVITELRRKYGVCYVQTHRLCIYPDVSAMQQETVSNSAVLGFVKFENGDPVVYLPAENALDPLAGDKGSFTLRHEALHIVFAEILGEYRMENIPCWFHEGMACCEALNEACYMPRRIALKFELWSDVSKMTQPEILFAETPSLEQTDHDYYLTCYELTRYILATRGNDVPNTILSNIIQGVDFERAFKSTCGTSTTDIYKEWYEKYY